MAKGVAEETESPVLGAEGLQFLLSGEDQVPIPSREEKITTCLFFSANWCRPCRNFTPLLIDLYNSINRTTKTLEIIFVSSDRDEMSFSRHYAGMPWLAVPFNPTLQIELRHQFGVKRIPSLIPLTNDGDGSGENVVQLVEDYGVDAFPFRARRREELERIDERKRLGGSLLDLVGSSGRDYVLSRDGSKLAIANLVGKTIGLYFGAHWCPPCRAFTAILMEAYQDLNSKNQATTFEVIFVSTDRNNDEFKLSTKNMPWLSIPYSEKRRQDLIRIFQVKVIPTLVILGPDGKPLGTDGRALVCAYGARAFPFTPSRAVEVEAMVRKEGLVLPRHVWDSKHHHMLKLDMAKAYVCDSCGGRGRFWVFSCGKCDYDLHPDCVERRM